MGEGLRYVVANPVLRNISIMMAIINLFGTTTSTQLVLFAHRQLHASNSEVGYLYAAGSAGVVVLSLTAGPLRRRLQLSLVALGALTLNGLAILGLGLTTSYVAGLILWGLAGGLGILFNINTTSLRQEMVPDRLLGRVMSIASVLAWSAIPIGSLAGGLIITATGDVATIYVVIGAITAAVALLFARTPIGHADRYLARTPQTLAAAG